MGKVDYVRARQHLVTWLRTQMIGPAGDDDFIQGDPLKRFPVGVLSPVEDSSLPSFEVPEISQSSEDSQDGPSYKRYYTAPSTVGFTLFVSHDAQLQIEASASHYERKDPRDKKGRFKRLLYRRIELEQFEKSIDQLESLNQKIWDGWASIVLETHSHRDGTLCTLSLCNERRGPKELRNPDKVESYLFEARLRCTVSAGQIRQLPRPAVSMMTEGEQELEIQYRDRMIFAVGHGTAVDWQVGPNCDPQVWSEFMPAVEMPALQTNPQGDHNALDLKFICGADINILSASMRDFLGGYKDWIHVQCERASEFAEDWQKQAAARMTAHMESTLRRMYKGVDLLCQDEEVQKAFRIANEAMLRQMQKADQIAGRNDVESKKYQWRSFQLAFLLAVLESVIQEESDYRETMDLIWFPTGGGKTEAYLGLIAITIVWRRLKFGAHGGGTVAIMRYTLRLLTRQQFERAARMICALELIRRKKENSDLGEDPINVGLWVGQAVTPNSFDQAIEKVDELKNDKSERYSLVLTSCPWCGEDLKCDSYEAMSTSFSFHCNSTSDCDIDEIPCQVVDHALYDNPPSLLISTIDKFARLPWTNGPRSFFFGHDDRRVPDLIIQDELHLVSGPLGSVAGVYEAGIDTIIRESGVIPKYIASTATINEVHDQVQSLYARNVNIFPPPGISCDDMYFARSDYERPGRMYMGYLAPNLSRQKSISPILAALITAPNILFGQDQNYEDLAEAWWTNIVFNRSLRDVSTNHNLLYNEVNDIGLDLIRRYQQYNEDMDCRNRIEEVQKRLKRPRVSELTSLRSAQACAVTFDELTHHRSHGKCLDVVLATNMISVGLDVSRLALMVVNGQPQSTGEYIQVTSRVGRGIVPGLVIVNYHVGQARSLAHYENFRPFHESFHRFVESSSITPFTYQTRNRALHSALVMTLRYLCQHLTKNNYAAKMGENQFEEHRIRGELLQRLKSACIDSSVEHKLLKHLQQLSYAWLDKAKECSSRNRALVYSGAENKKDADRLLKSPESSKSGLWDTLHSMRNVEENTTVRGGYIEMKLRLSELLRYSGVGSIVRHDDNSLYVVKDISKWKWAGSRSNHALRYVDQISRHPKIDGRRLIKPPVSEGKGGHESYISAKKFPRWKVCAKCGLIHSPRFKEEKCSDRECDGGLEQIKWVLVHRSGCLADVDWHYMAHKENPESCPRNEDKAYLQLTQKDGKRIVKCKKCGQQDWKATMYFGKMTWQQPWIQIAAGEDGMEQMAEVMPIGDSRMYVPDCHRALVIPPESRILRGTVVDRLYQTTDDQKRMNDAHPGLGQRSMVRRIASEYGCRVEDINDARLKIENGYPLYDNPLPPSSSMWLEEYKALRNPIPDLKENEDLVTRHKTIEWEELIRENRRKGEINPVISLVDCLVSVERLRMISIFTGFRREAFRHRALRKGTLKRAKLVPPNILGVGDDLPAVELYGEGIFFTLREAILEEWIQVTLSKRENSDLDKFLNNISLAQSNYDEAPGTPKFVFCHSLSHLIICQLERKCGYPSSSLQERIYCDQDGERIAGILIFVAVPDRHGSLGGLMQFAEPKKFYRLISEALEKVQWCSFDPVCSNSQNRKFEQLNGAACHACLMIPESSCCCGNQYLDRSMINSFCRNPPSSMKMKNH